MEGSRPYAIIKATLNNLQTIMDLVYQILVLLFLFLYKQLINYLRDQGALFTTYLDKFNK